MRNDSYYGAGAGTGGKRSAAEYTCHRHGGNGKENIGAQDGSGSVRKGHAGLLRIRYAAGNLQVQHGMAMPTIDNFVGLSVLFGVSINDILVLEDASFIMISA